MDFCVLGRSYSQLLALHIYSTKKDKLFRTCIDKWQIYVQFWAWIFVDLAWRQNWAPRKKESQNSPSVVNSGASVVTSVVGPLWQKARGCFTHKSFSMGSLTSDWVVWKKQRFAEYLYRTGPEFSFCCWPELSWHIEFHVDRQCQEFSFKERSLVLS